VTDLESMGVLVQRQSELPGEVMRSRSPIQQIVTRVLGEIPAVSTDPIPDLIPGMRQGSSLYRAARLAIPSDDGITVSAGEPVLVNYQLTTVGWRLAEAVLRGALEVDASMADMLRE
jgi:hypothetical protein